MNIELFRLSLALGVGRFWSPPTIPVEALFTRALHTLRATQSEALRRRIVRALFVIANESPDHDERIAALATLFDYYGKEKRVVH